jgi:hypothetical protein
MLFFVVHRLGGSRKSAREVGASRLFCFTAGFSGSPNGIRFQAGWRHSLPVHNPTNKKGRRQLLRDLVNQGNSLACCPLNITFSFAARAQLQITTSSVPAVTQYQSYSATLAATGGMPPS